MKDTLIDEKSIDHLLKFFKTERGRIAYCIVTEKKIHERPFEPCYGGLHNYKKSGISKPPDLKHNFPDQNGKILGVGVSFNGRISRYSKPQIDFILSPKGPWRNSFGSGLVYDRNEQGDLLGVILKDTKIDPTPFVQALLCTTMSNYYSNKDSMFNVAQTEGFSPTVSFLSQLAFAPLGYGIGGFRKKDNELDYYILGKINLTKFKDGRPDNITSGKELFYDGGTYNRRDVASVWSGGGEGINKTLSDVISKAKTENKLGFTLYSDSFVKKEFLPALSKLVD